MAEVKGTLYTEEKFVKGQKNNTKRKSVHGDLFTNSEKREKDYLRSWQNMGESGGGKKSGMVACYSISSASLHGEWELLQRGGSRAEVAIKFPVMLMNHVSVSVIPHDRTCSGIFGKLGTWTLFREHQKLASEVLKGSKKERIQVL